MEIMLPSAGIILLIGPSNSGKSTLLQKKIEQGEILPTEIVSSDTYRAMVGDRDFYEWNGRPKDESDSLYDVYQSVSKEAFKMMDAVAEARSRLNKRTFIDATHLHADDRQRYRDMAERNDLPVIALLLDSSEEELLERDAKRKEPRGKRRIKQQYRIFKREKRIIKKEKYKAVFTVANPDEITFLPQKNPLEKEIGPGIDVIGDIHGCYEELLELLGRLGYAENDEGLYVHPAGRKFVSLGDVMSRGPRSLETMKFMYEHISRGLAYMTDSNHGWKMARWLDGRKVVLSHGDERTAAEFEAYEAEQGPEIAGEWKQKLKEMLLKAPSHYVFTKNGVPVLVCTHAGIKDAQIGKQSPAVSDYCRYGDTDGVDETGKPIRKDWYHAHENSLLIVWGHDPKPAPLLVNQTLNIDQGAVFGGSLTGLRYPEQEFVSVKAAGNYSGTEDHPLSRWEKERLNPPNLAKFIHGYSVRTTDLGDVKVASDVVKTAIDAVSHVTVPIEQLVYIPPTMSPAPAPSSLPDYLEHPKEVFDYYRKHGIKTMIAEKKHMGSRAVLLLFKDGESAVRYTGIDSAGIIYTRSGRRFFSRDSEAEVLAQLQNDLASYFKKYETDFVLLDAEIMPWNLKAKELISSQYAHVAEQAVLDREIILDKLTKAGGRHDKISEWLSEYEAKLNNARTFSGVFQKYCWDIQDLSAVQIAPFHVLAHSGRTFFDRPHIWHMEQNRELAGLSSLFVETAYKVITDEESEEAVTRWWQEMTEDGHEGIVIKPEFFTASHNGKLLQPAMKVRGRKYLNIIYGMDYLFPENLERLKKRNTGKKQKMALREFALGLEGIRRFAGRESLERVHECVLAALAMEADPADPRL